MPCWSTTSIGHRTQDDAYEPCGPDGRPTSPVCGRSTEGLYFRRDHHWEQVPERQRCPRCDEGIGGLLYGADLMSTTGGLVGLLDGLRGRQAKASAGSVGVPFHFAVVDLETTGLNPAKDRILEVAVVLSDSHGQVLHEWCTLVNPGKEFGAGHIHGIDGSWLAAAPSFAELAAEIGTRLNGRVLVGHNASFDAGFLEAEFARAGYRFAESFPVLDTMAIATAVGLPSGLRSACEQIGYQYEPHTALGDARAATALLHRLLPVVDRATFDGGASGSPVVPSGFFPAGATAVAPVARGVAAHATTARDLLADAIYRLPPHDPSADRDPAAAEAYLDVLASAVADGYVSSDEFEELVGVATRSGLSEPEVRDLHHEFVLGLLDAALGDRRISKAEREAVERAATWLGVDLSDWDAMVKAARTA